MHGLIDRAHTAGAEQTHQSIVTEVTPDEGLIGHARNGEVSTSSYRESMYRAVLATLITLVVLPELALATPFDDANERVTHGLQLYATGDLEGARREWGAAQALVPGKPNPYRLLAMVDLRLGHCGDAVREAELFLSLAPPDDRRRPDVESLRDQCKRELLPKLGSLHVSSTPPGAEVRLDDEQARVAGETPLTVGVSVGRHVVFVGKARFATVTRPVDVAPGGTVQLDVALAPSSARSEAPRADDAILRAAQELAREANESARAMREERDDRRRTTRARYIHSRNSQIAVGAVFSAIGIAAGATGLAYWRASDDAVARLKADHLLVAQQQQIVTNQPNYNYLIWGPGLPGGIFCVIGLPILTAGLAKLKMPVELRAVGGERP
jgi:hypothetical protein